MRSAKRPYSAIAEPRTPLAPLENAESRDNIPSNHDDRVAKRSLPWKREKASPQSILNNASQWSHRLYKTHEGKPIMVHYCSSLATTDKVAQLFANEPVLGFDMEWKWPGATPDKIQENVSVIQLASRDRIAIFHIARFQPNSQLNNLVSPKLKAVIENPNILKAGVNIKGDCSRLLKWLKIDARGTFELSHLHKLIKYCHAMPKLVNRARVKLADQVQEHFGLPLAKERSVRCSNWSKPITAQQAHYAAADAYAGYQLFVVMDAKRRALTPVPPLPAFDELGLAIRITNVEKDKSDQSSKPESPTVSDSSSEPQPKAELPKSPRRRGRPRKVDSGVKVDPMPMKAAVKATVMSRKRSRKI
ncbi:ribonuclease H-like domain-containing protein [Aspergillus unguis]